MKQKNNIWFFLLIIASILVSIAPFLLAVPKSLNIPSNDPYTTGMLFGYMFWYILILTAVPLLIDSLISYFKKDKQKSQRRWWLIWLIFLFISIGSFSRYIDKCANIITTNARKQSTAGCVSEIKKEASKVTKTSMTPSQLKLFSNPEKYCAMVSDIYFDCIQKKDGTQESCKITVAQKAIGLFTGITGVKKQFSAGCISGIKKEASKTARANRTPLLQKLFSNSEKYCAMVSDIYFDCIQKKEGTRESCGTIAAQKAIKVLEESGNINTIKE